MSANSPPIADPEDLLGTYAFLPWLRQGMANAITAPPAGGTFVKPGPSMWQVDITGSTPYRRWAAAHSVSRSRYRTLWPRGHLGH